MCCCAAPVLAASGRGNRLARLPASRRSALGGTPKRRRSWSLNWRTLPKPARRAISVIGRALFSTSSRARSRRRRPRDLARRRAEVGGEETAQLARADTEAIGDGFDAVAVEGALVDQAQRARHCRSGAAPRRGSRRGLRATAAAGAEAGGGGFCRGREEAHVLAPRPRRGADRAAEDARGDDARVEAAVEAGVARGVGGEAAVRIEGHGGHTATLAREFLRVGGNRTWHRAAPADAISRSRGRAAPPRRRDRARRSAAAPRAPASASAAPLRRPGRRRSPAAPSAGSARPPHPAAR